MIGERLQVEFEAQGMVRHGARERPNYRGPAECIPVMWFIAARDGIGAPSILIESGIELHAIDAVFQ